jgi:short-subunit dehydrogenase
MYSFLIYLFLILFTSILFRNIYRKYLFNNQAYINSNSVILITGGCQGIGREIIQFLLTNYKCTIINIDLSKDKFKELEDSFNSGDTGKVINYHCDLSDSKNIDSCVTSILSHHKVDFLINNAGISYNKCFEQLNDINFSKTVNVNLLAPMQLCKKLLIHKTKHQEKLHIVNVASVMSHITSSKSTDYCSSKWGLFAFHECMRYDYYGSDAFKFTIICPFAVNTGMFQGFVSPLPFVNILNVNDVAEMIVRSIILNDKIVFLPFYMEYIALAFKLLPISIRDYLYFKLSK